MALRTMAVIARKGGAGKTTVAIHLAIGAFLRGRKTLLADMDGQKSALEVLRARRRLGPDRIDCTGSKLFAQKMAASRQGYEDLIVDTAAGEEEEMASAITLADLSILVVRPTFLDIASAAQTGQVIRRLRRPAIIVMNQAQSPRSGAELPAVARAMEALQILNLPICSTIIRSRTIYQTAMDKGFSAEESEDLAAMREIGALMRDLESAIERV